MNDRSFENLKQRHRAERDAYPPALSLRVHRALSWLDRAEREADDLDGRFIFLWIAFNAAYAAEDGGQEITETRRFSQFLRSVLQLDKDGVFATLVWHRYPGPIRLLLDNRFAFKPFWDSLNGIDYAIDWPLLFREDTRRAHAALGRQDTHTVLHILFRRLYVVRNQLMHGGSTWGSSVNRKQLADGAAILGDVVPRVIEVLMNHPQQDWGAPCYPLIQDDDPAAALGQAG
ncbi:MAG: HEPN domain-containing protein [Wenzhouxiangellaceae bacterium]|nr:HEPN domain-containing protein [Wenzhouxiangellaceae bacterium]